MVAKTYFVLLDSRMEFSHSNMQMILNRIHRYYPLALQPAVSKLREAMIGLYRKAKGEMVYNATYEHDGKRFNVKEQIYIEREAEQSCNFSISIDTPDPETRTRYEDLANGLREIDPVKTYESKADFRHRLIEFEKIVRQGNNKRTVFGETKLHDICVIVGDILGRFDKELFVIDHTLGIEDRVMSVTFAGYRTKSHVITITATDAS